MHKIKEIMAEEEKEDPLFSKITSVRQESQNYQHFNTFHGPVTIKGIGSEMEED